jgi:hypothetical protein
MDRNCFWLNERQFARLEPHLPTDSRTAAVAFYHQLCGAEDVGAGNHTHGILSALSYIGRRV